MYSVKPQNCYYELKRKCLIKKNNHFSSEQIEITEDDWGKLADLHRNALKKEFEITKKWTQSCDPHEELAMK